LKADRATEWMTPSFQQGKPYHESESQFELANPGGNS